MHFRMDLTLAQTGRMCSIVGIKPNFSWSLPVPMRKALMRRGESSEKFAAWLQ